ncbi:MAG: hypothetical protein IKO52_14195 [Clostridia bacterium]|nr:hypothetical protein [Clostridia bacterium]
MIKRLKGWFGASPSRLPALAAFVCAAFCLTVGFAKYPRLYAIDFGQYEIILSQCGLTWTPEDLALGDLQYVRPLVTFSYTRFSWASLLSPNTGGSTVYAVALVRLFTAPFGLPFSIDALSFVWALLLALAAGLITGALHEKLPRAWMVPALILCLVYTDGNFCAIFRSLYPEAAAIAFSLLFIASALRAFFLDEDRRVRWLLPLAFLSILLLKSLSPMIVFLPPVLAVNGWLIYSCRKSLPRKILALVLTAAVLFGGVGSAIQLAGSDVDYFSNASLYESAFNALLREADDPEAILADWGLDESYLGDVGKSFYEPEESYVHNPRDKDEAEKLFSRLSSGKILSAYLSRPGLLIKALCAQELWGGKGFENTRNSTLTPNEKGFSAARTEGGPLAFLWKILPLNWAGFFFIQLLLTGLWAALAIRKRRMAPGLIALFSLCSTLFLPFALILNGYAQSQQYMLCQTFLTVTLLTELLCLVIYSLPLAVQWFTRYMEEPYVVAVSPLTVRSAEGPSPSPLKTLKRWAEILSAHPFPFLLLTGLVCAAILTAVYLPSNHPASVNNGDYGRMMEQLDITWDSMTYFNTDSQAGHYAIEDYAYTSGFDFLKLTPLKPTYSLYWFAGLLRLLTEPLGLGFSTYLLAWLMGVIMLACVLQIVSDLFPLLGKWIAPAAALLILILFNETYLTWFNSLFGEGSILLGLLLSVMCAVHLCVMPRKKSWKRPAWLLGLFLSLNILITAKSQMVMALPGGALLFLTLCWYHRPYRYDLQAVQGLVALALCGVLAFSGLGVYQTDRTEDSVSQKHTMWQAYFYGIFMISDDPIGDMEALGVDTAMAPDIGKYVSFGDDIDYVYKPLSDEAQTGFYDHVSMLTIVKWYLTHPAKLWYMLDHAARESKSLYTGFRVYVGQDYSALDHDDVNGWNLWPGWRSWLTPGSFLGYILHYGALLALCIWYMLRKDCPLWKRMLCTIPLFLMITGVLQFPLSVLGNGFADNQKQLFCFSLCHDFLLGGTLLLILRLLLWLPETAKWTGETWKALKERLMKHPFAGR